MNNLWFVYFNKKTFFISVVFFLIFLVSMIPGPSILGLWESYTYYYNFGALETPFDFRIPLRAFGSNPAIFSLGFSRIFLEFFEINPSLFNYRILSVLYGLITLFLFFVVVKRWFGLIPSLFATALLSVNPLFHINQHMMTQLMASGLAFIFLIERLQSLELRYTSKFAWIGLGGAITLVVFHYTAGLIFALLFTFLWLVKFFFVTRYHHNGQLVMKNIFNKFLLSLAFCAILSIILNWKNLFSLIQFYNIIFPIHGEYFFNQNYSSVSAGVLLTLKTNAYVLFESLTGLGTAHHAITTTYRLTDIKYPILNPLLFIFFISGIIVSIINFKKRILLFSMPYISSLLLLLVCLLPLLASSYLLYEGRHIVTLHNFRMFYLLFPLYLLIAIFFDFLLKKTKANKNLNFIIFFTFFLIFLLGIKNIVDEKRYLITKLNSVDYKISGIQSYSQWKDGAKHTEESFRSDSKLLEHLQLHAQYYNIAQKVRDSLKVDQNNNYYILKLNLDKLQKIKEFHYSSLNYNSVFFPLYLNSLGIKTAWVQVIYQKNSKITLGRTYVPYKYSATLINKNNKIQYKELSDLKAYLRYSGSEIPHIILVTTEEELNFAKKFFKNKDIKGYHLFDI